MRWLTLIGRAAVRVGETIDWWITVVFGAALMAEFVHLIHTTTLNANPVH